MHTASPLSQTLTDVIRARMKAREVSIKGLSEAADIPQVTLHRKLKGAYPWKSDELERIAYHLGTSFYQLAREAEVLAEQVAS